MLCISTFLQVFIRQESKSNWADFIKIKTPNFVYAVKLNQLIFIFQSLCSQVYSEQLEEPRSAFSPLVSAFQRNFASQQANRRFLTAPYSGTGYLPTIMRPQSEYPTLPLQPPGGVPDLYSGNTASRNDEKSLVSSPGSATGSDKTSFSE